MPEGPENDPLGLVGGSLAGRFRVDRLVARGGFGYVYAGRHVALDSAVALKIMHEAAARRAAAHPEFFDDFAREARTAARLRHPHIVSVLDHGVAALPGGTRAPWIALEWLEGATLRAALEARRGAGGRAPAECLALLRPVFDALAYAHAERVAHRDVKPDNIVLAAAGRRGSATKLLDFGIAKQLHDDEAAAGTGETRTDSSRRAFSTAYAAPEQVGGTRTGPWTDVHALGLLVTEVLTDALPYDGADRTEMCCDVLAARRPTPRKRGLDVGAWEAVIARAVALRPGDRFADAGEFLRALEAALPAARHAPSEPGTSDEPMSWASAGVHTTLRTVTASAPPPPRGVRARARRAGVGLAFAAATLAIAFVVARAAPRAAGHARPPPPSPVAAPSPPSPVAAPSPALPAPVAPARAEARPRPPSSHVRAARVAVHATRPRDAVNGHTRVRVQ